MPGDVELAGVLAFWVEGWVLGEGEDKGGIKMVSICRIVKTVRARTLYEL